MQPVAFQHDIHVGQLGLDCRFCHSYVEVSGHSNVPNTQTCMNCHTQVAKDNPKLKPVRDSWATGVPIQWVKVHNVPDYAYFNHSAHVNRGVSCVRCHGKVNEMTVVWQHESQSMGCVSPVPPQSGKCRPSHRRRQARRAIPDLQSPNWEPPEGQIPVRALASNFVHELENQSAERLRGVSPMKRIFNHPPAPKTGKHYWRSLEEYADTPESFRAKLEREFPQGAAELEGNEVTRRGFMQFMGASLALAGLGLTGCRRPELHIVPMSKGVEWQVPGNALHYATSMARRGGADPAHRHHV